MMVIYSMGVGLSLGEFLSCWWLFHGNSGLHNPSIRDSRTISWRGNIPPWSWGPFRCPWLLLGPGIMKWPQHFGAGELLYTSSRLSTEIPEIVIFGALVFTLKLGSRFPTKENNNNNLLPGSVTTNWVYYYLPNLRLTGYNKRRLHLAKQQSPGSSHKIIWLQRAVRNPGIKPPVIIMKPYRKMSILSHQLHINSISTG